MNVVVAMAWRPTPARIYAHDKAVAYWQRNFPGWPLIEVDTDHHPYNLAAVRNKGVREAEALGAEVVILADADVVIATPYCVHRAVIEAFEDGKFHLPFANQRYLTADETERLDIAGEFQFDATIQGEGCCHVVRPDRYWVMGGSDERFSGWGGDDQAATAAASTLIGIKRHGGVAYSMYHADECRDVGSERWQPNSDLAMRYEAARINPDAMRQLIAEPGRHA